MVAKIKNIIANVNIFNLGNSLVIYYILVFFVGPLIIESGIFSSLSKREQISSQAFLYLLAGLASFCIGYWTGMPKKLAEKIPNIFKSEWNLSRVPRIFWAVFVVGIAIKIIRIMGGGYHHLGKSEQFLQNPFYSLLGLLDWTAYIAFAIAFGSYFYFRKIGDRRSIYWQIIAWSVFAIEILYAIPSCNRTLVIIPFILYFLIKSYLEKFNYRVMIPVMIAVVLVVFPLGGTCKNMGLLKGSTSILYSGNNHLSFVHTSNVVVESVVTRINQSMVFSKIIETNPTSVKGSSLSTFIASFGPPRFIWKNKPSINGNGNALGRELGFLGPDDFTTNIGVTTIGDLYLNFGIAGIIGGVFIMGFLFRVVYAYCISITHASLSGVMLYSIIWIQAVRGIEDWIAPVYSGIIKTIIIAIIIHYSLVWKRKEISEHTSSLPQTVGRTQEGRVI